MKKKLEAILIITVVIIGIIIKLLTEIAIAISNNMKPLLIIFITVGLAFFAYQIFIIMYFRSIKFNAIKNNISEYTKNCNELNHYIQELKCSYVNIKSYDFGQSRMLDNSNYNFERKEWSKDIKSNEVHHCSAVVCKSANNQPFKYLSKYFNVDKNEETLSSFESVLNDFTSVEEGKVMLQKERDLILANIRESIPKIIYFYSKKKLIKELGFEAIDFSDLYIPIFTFQYVSAGGNSSSKCDIELNIENLNKLIRYLNDEIKWRKSVAGQRALMTSKLRQTIKERDNFTCCNCNLSIEDERNLLLEIDHIIPVSKGGVTSENNLQTLCWRCNRTKGSKIEMKELGN